MILNFQNKSFQAEKSNAYYSRIYFHQGQHSSHLHVYLKTILTGLLYFINKFLSLFGITRDWSKSVVYSTGFILFLLITFSLSKNTAFTGIAVYEALDNQAYLDG